MHFVGIFLTVFLLSAATASWVPYADPDSCVGRCDTLDPSLNCQCNMDCEGYGDCCKDYHYVCLGADQACFGRCGQDYDSSDACHCNNLCKQYDNCCGDYDAYCIPENSCYQRCGDALDPSQPCQCNTACEEYGDCCPDFKDQCNGNCDPITGGDLSRLADDLWASDTNRADPTQYTLNKQTQVQDGNTVDQAPEKLFSYVDPEVLKKPTFAAFISLIDNYNPQYGVNEDVTPEETIEKNDFFDLLMETKVMTKAANFAISKCLATDKADWRAKVEAAWFTLYKRSSPTDSSGFEHVYLGEYKSGNKVNGFHNWVQFYMLEQSGDLNYYGYVREDTTTNLIGACFNWNGYMKAMGSLMYGASPEFEIAMMGTCFLAFPGKQCNFVLQGNPLKVQTYTIFNDYVGSAYFMKTDLIGACFDWNGYIKAMGTIMYGASVEFEMAMMTACFLAYPDEKRYFKLNTHDISIQTYSITSATTKCVASAYFSM